MREEVGVGFGERRFVGVEERDVTGHDLAFEGFHKLTRMLEAHAIDKKLKGLVKEKSKNSQKVLSLKNK